MGTHPLRIRAFRLMFIGRSLAMLGDAVVPAALTIAIVQSTGSAAALATVLVCALVPRLVLLPLGGVLAQERAEAAVLAGRRSSAGAPAPSSGNGRSQQQAQPLGGRSVATRKFAARCLRPPPWWPAR